MIPETLADVQLRIASVARKDSKTTDLVARITSREVNIVRLVLLRRGIEDEDLVAIVEVGHTEVGREVARLRHLRA